MTLCLFIWKSCVYTCWKKWRPFFFSHSPTIVDEKYFRWKWTHLRKIYQGRLSLFWSWRHFLDTSRLAKISEGTLTGTIRTSWLFQWKPVLVFAIYWEKKTESDNTWPGADSGAIAPLKPTKIALFTMILYKSENIIRDIKPFCGPLFCQRSVVKYTSPPVVNP